MTDERKPKRILPYEVQGKEEKTLGLTVTKCTEHSKILALDLRLKLIRILNKYLSMRLIGWS